MLNNLINQGFVVNADQISFLHHPNEYKNKLIDLIKQAKKRILLNCLYLENDQSGKLVVDALKQAVLDNPQLKVDIFLDFHRALRSRIGEQAKLANALWYFEELHDFNAKLVQEHGLARSPINIHGIPCNSRELFGVYHIKGYVFDDLVLYSGTSINNNYLSYQTYRQDRYQIIDNAEFAQAFYEFTISNFASEPIQEVQPGANIDQARKVIAVFNKEQVSKPNKQIRGDFKEFRGNYLRNPNLQYPATKQENNLDLTKNLLPSQVVIKPLFGIGKNNSINNTVFEVIAQAQEIITIYTPYFNFTKSFCKSLIDKCAAGVKVQVIVSDKVANDFYTDPNGESYTAANSLPYLYEMNLRKFLQSYSYLIDQGTLEVYAWSHDNNSYHAKGIAVDNKYYIFTGSNLNLRSFNVDTENALLCYDPYLTLKEQIDKEFAYFNQHLTKLTSYNQIQTKKEYPARVRKTLRRASFFFIDKLAKRLF